MKKLNEDKLPPRLYVRFSNAINTQIISINTHNQDNIEELLQWRDYLNTIKNYISNPIIAWDYTGRYQHYPNGATYIRDFGFNVGFTIKTSNRTHNSYVYVFKVNLKPEEFGLKVPPILNENKQHPSDKIIYRMKESQLRRIIQESIKQVLSLI